MTKRKSTKRTLVMSLISMILCCAMFIGTTFAWFTDSVESKNNIIQAGNLDVELEYYDTTAKEWYPVGSNTSLFEEGILWEPGRTDVVYLRVKNAGSLALKYQFGMNILNETPGVNVYDDSFHLSSYIEFGVIHPEEETFFENRAEARAAVVNSKKISDGYSKESHLVPKTESTEELPYQEYATLIVYMPETVDNKANYLTDKSDPDKYQPKIELGINVLATQYTFEEDSFGNDYDAGAAYEDNSDSSYIKVSTVEELATNVSAGNNVVLLNDITLSEAGLAVNATDADVIIDLAGHNLELTNSSGIGSLKGKINVISTSDSPANISLASNSLIMAMGVDAVVNIKNVNIITGSGIEERLQMGDGGTINYYGGTIQSSGSFAPVYVYGGFDNDATFNMYSGEIIVAENSSGIDASHNASGNSVVNLYGGKITATNAYAKGINAYKAKAVYISEEFVFDTSDTSYALVYNKYNQQPTLTGKLPESILTY